MSKKRVHLVCNAHLDPVWLWHWEDGLAEALSTFSVDSDLCEKHRGFFFNHNEALLYRWVEEYEPQLFRRIQKLVKQGRWFIA
ncbi:MAG: alpha-mannosidase, partial [Candidatus Latescibacteria bacterium]|nr:alpha-mannosidase [Candidatus Latescibacterota bacterium]